MFNQLFKNMSEEDIKGIKIFAFMALCLALFVTWLVVNSLTKGPSPDRNTLCIPGEKSPVHHIIIFDTTDKLTESHVIYMRGQSDGKVDEGGTIQKTINESPTGARFTVYLIDSQKYKGLSNARFDMCKPKTAKETNALTESERAVKRKFKKFEQSLLELADDLSGQNTQSQSPLAEAMSDLFLRADPLKHPTEHRTIHLYSDLLQNSDMTSVYRGDSIPIIHTCSTEKAVDKFIIHRLRRSTEKGRKLQDVNLINGWVRSLDRCASDLKFTPWI